MLPYEKAFLEGARKIGKISDSLAKDIWQEMLGFADYGFNKSHSVCYSYLSYVCAWLKANYPHEFFAALMSVRSTHSEKWKKAPEYVFEAKARGIDIRGPNINRSDVGFALDGDQLYWGFQAIKGIGASTGEAIVRARGKTKFQDIWDFLDRVDITKVNLGSFRALALAGAFDCLGYDRQTLYDQAQDLYDHLKLEEKQRERAIAKAEVEIENQRREDRKAELTKMLDAAKARKKAKTELTTEDLWILERDTRLKGLRELARQCKLTNSDISSVMTPEEISEYEESLWLRKKPVPQVPDVPPRWSLPRYKQVPITVEALQTQKHYCGAYIGAHPAQVLFPDAKSLSTADTGDYGMYAGEVLEVKEITTKKGNKMAFATLEDELSRCELVIFPNTWSKLVAAGDADKLDGSICLVKGRVETLEPLKLIVDAIKLSEEKHE